MTTTASLPSYIPNPFPVESIKENPERCQHEHEPRVALLNGRCRATLNHALKKHRPEAASLRYFFFSLTTPIREIAKNGLVLGGAAFGVCAGDSKFEFQHRETRAGMDGEVLLPGKEAKAGAEK